MKSYFLGIVIAIALSGIYITYNTAEVTINYLGFQTSVNQGLWEVFLFGIGAIIMWILSIGASIESYTANKKRARELNNKIEDLENEKKSLLAALQNVGHPRHTVQTQEILPEITTKESAAEKTKTEETAPPPVKNFFASMFKSDRKPDSKDQTEVIDQIDTAVQAEICDQTQVCDEAEICDQTEVFDQIGVCDQTDDTDYPEPFEAGVCYPAEPDDETEVHGEKDEAGENDEGAEDDEDRDDNSPYGSVCELDLDFDDDEVPEEDGDSPEKEDREIFTV